MAPFPSIKKNIKTISYRFRACVGRDESGKQIFRSTTWTAPQGLAPSKAEKAAQKAAALWERDVKAEYEKDLHDPDRIKAREIAQLKTDFVSFVEQDWFPSVPWCGNCPGDCAAPACSVERLEYGMYLVHI